MRSVLRAAAVLLALAFVSTVPAEAGHDGHRHHHHHHHHRHAHHHGCCAPAPVYYRPVAVVQPAYQVYTVVAPAPVVTYAYTVPVVHNELSPNVGDGRAGQAAAAAG